MTISTTTIKNSFSGNGSTTAFTYTFPINTTAEILVIERSATGTETVRAEGSGSTNYGIVNNGAAGGIVTMVTAPVSGVTLILRRNTALTQETDYVANDPFPAETHEDALDKLQMQTQELQEQADRSFKVSRTNIIASSEFTDNATARASKTLGFDSDGNLTTVADFLPAGGDSAQFTYSTTVTVADPGSGFIRFNNTTISSATIAYIDDAEANGTDVVAWVQSFDDVTGNATNRGRIRVSKANTLDTWHVFKVNAAITDASGYTKIPLTYIDGAGSLANNDKVFVSFVASGEDGAIPGYLYKFATSTTDGDPGAGILRFDNGTYADVTEIYIDDADANGGATQADTETWGSSTSTIKGFLHIVDINDSSTYARFKVTAAVTDASGYNKITVVHLASNNTFSAADELSVHFTRTGLKGDTGATGSTGPTGATGDVSLAGTQTLTNKTINASQLVNASIAVGKMAANSVDSDQYVDGSIDTIHIAADQITNAKIADDQIDSEHYVDGSIDTAHIADGQVTTAKLATAVFTGATDIGAAIVDADLFLMDDGAGGTIRKTTAARIKTYAGGGNTPQFQAYLNANQTIANDTLTKVAFGHEQFDPQSTFNVSNGRFTPAVAGNYFLHTAITFNNADNDYAPTIQFRLNGTNIHWITDGATSNTAQYQTVACTTARTLDTDDYIEIFVRQQSGGNVALHGGADSTTIFGGFKIT